jgi:hypothetical protein
MARGCVRADTPYAEHARSLDPQDAAKPCENDPNPRVSGKLTQAGSGRTAATCHGPPCRRPCAGSAHLGGRGARDCVGGQALVRVWQPRKRSCRRWSPTIAIRASPAVRQLTSRRRDVAVAISARGLRPRVELRRVAHASAVHRLVEHRDVLRSRALVLIGMTPVDLPTNTGLMHAYGEDHVRGQRQREACSRANVVLIAGANQAAKSVPNEGAHATQQSRGSSRL